MFSCFFAESCAKRRRFWNLCLLDFAHAFSQLTCSAGDQRVMAKNLDLRMAVASVNRGRMVEKQVLLFSTSATCPALSRTGWQTVQIPRSALAVQGAWWWQYLAAIVPDPVVVKGGAFDAPHRIRDLPGPADWNVGLLSRANQQKYQRMRALADLSRLPGREKGVRCNLRQCSCCSGVSSSGRAGM